MPKQQRLDRSPARDGEMSFCDRSPLPTPRATVVSPSHHLPTETELQNLIAHNLPSVLAQGAQLMPDTPSALSVAGPCHSSAALPHMSLQAQVLSLLQLGQLPQLGQQPQSLHMLQRPQIQPQPQTGQASLDTRALFELPNVYFSEQQLYAANVLQNLMSYDFSDSHHAQMPMTPERYGPSNPLLTQILEAIRSNLPSATSTSQRSESTSYQERVQQTPSPNPRHSMNDSPIASARPKRKNCQMESSVYGDGDRPLSRKTPKHTAPQPVSSRKGKERSAASASSSRLELPAKAARLFTATDGTRRRPLRIFVHFELGNRNEIVRVIKESGGKIEADPTEADYCVLAPRGSTFQMYQRQATDAGRPIVSDIFITASVASRKLLDPVDYIPGRAHVKLRRKNSSNAQQPEFPEKGNSKHRYVTYLDVESSSEEEPRAKSKDSARVKSVRVVHLTSGPRKDSATSQVVPVLAANNKFKYTEAEMTLAWEEIRRLAEQDAGLTITPACTTLAEKMPHHSHGSWRKRISKNENRKIFDQILEETRRPPDDQRRSLSESLVSTSRAGSPASPGIKDARSSDGDNKAANHLAKAAILEDLHASGNHAKMGQLDGEFASILTSAPPLGIEESERYDLETAVQFLLEDVSDDEDDEGEVWKKLEQHASPCKSAASWSDFLAKHSQTVIDEAVRYAEAKNRVG